MASEYVRAMDALSLSEDEKAALAARITAAAAGMEKDALPANDNDACAPARGMTVPVRKVRRPRFRFAAAAAAVAAMVALGGAAYAAVGGISVEQALDQLFNGAPAETEVIDAIGRPIGASVTSNGVTITADAVIGDASTYTVIYSIVRDDGEPFDIPADAAWGDKLPLGFADCTSDLFFARNGGSYGGSWFYDADPSNPSIQYVDQRSVQPEDMRSITGETLVATMRDLMIYGDDGERTLLAQGSWKLRFKLEYGDSSVELPAGSWFDLNGMQAQVEALSISPVSLDLAYAVAEELRISENENGRMSGENSEALDRFLYPGVITVSFKDGTAMQLEDYSGGTSYDNGMTHCRKNIIFDRVVDVDQVASIQIGDTVIPVA